MELKIPVKVEYTNIVVDICREHPTCEGCPFQEKHKGCYFRGKTPREWEFPKEFEIIDAIPLDKVKKAKEEIENINPVYSTISDRIPVLKNCDDIKAEVLEILDKLIAESEEESEEK